METTINASSNAMLFQVLAFVAVCLIAYVALKYYKTDKANT